MKVHCAATRVVAESYFDSDAVLGGLLDDSGVESSSTGSTSSASPLHAPERPGVARVRRLVLLVANGISRSRSPCLRALR